MADYADSYTLRGCYVDWTCGVFARAEARCATGSGARCPGGASAAGNTDPTLCDGAPVYQQQTGRNHYVLLRVSEQGGGTRWWVSESSSLGDCEVHKNPGANYDYPRSDLNPGRPGYAPTAPAYGQWTPQRSISVVAGGGR
eukprot:COSAG06_NODE_24399_length_664_cov_0.849558_1_plen_141_part_00